MSPVRQILLKSDMFQTMLYSQIKVRHIPIGIIPVNSHSVGTRKLTILLFETLIGIKIELNFVIGSFLVTKIEATFAGRELFPVINVSLGYQTLVLTEFTTAFDKQISISLIAN